MNIILIILAILAIILLSVINKKYESFDKKDYAICLWGQPRAIKSTYENFYKKMVEPLNADVFMVLQEIDNEDNHDIDNTNLYKKVEGKITYHNPNVNEIYKTYYKLIKNTNNYNNDTHLKVFYNYIKINEIFGNLFESNYKYIILSRTDFLHLFNFPDILKLSPESLDNEIFWCYDGHEYEGINATLICIPSSKIREYLTFYYNFLQDDNNVDYLNEQNTNPSFCIEYFLNEPFKKNNWKVGKIENNSFITADSKDEVTTWGQVLYSVEHDVLYKYNEQIDNAYNSLSKVEEGSNWKYINEDIDRIVLVKS